MLITDPWFYAAAIPAVLIFGIAKGGFGGGLGAAAVPLMALVISPVQAAAILLPILCLMDIVTLWAYRGKWDLGELRLLLPASIVGIAIGTWSFEYLSADAIRLCVGIVAVAFTLHYIVNRLRPGTGDLPELPRGAAAPAAAVAGFTSFIAHAGGPPLNMYLLRRPLDRTGFVATTAVFFAIVNYVKLIPYGFLGQLSTQNLMTSAALAVFAPVGVYTGVWLHKRVSDQTFFAVVYTILLVLGARLIFDGIGGIGGVNS
ncbi:MAG: sulfite exporter TauE/SafE family protein [Woeseiaceae bacterium]|nr:sulfite exporter TauE/SafE family protein [Woeseiaceae bacterium]